MDRMVSMNTSVYVLHIYKYLSLILYLYKYLFLFNTHIVVVFPAPLCPRKEVICPS